MDVSGVNNLWMIVATFLVLLMQCGFLMLEGGRVRSKNSINVAQKNAADLVVVWVSFFATGFYLMFGISLAEMSGSGPVHQDVTPLTFVFQFAFACTTATIVSGAIVERVSFRAYLVLVACMTALVYPLVGRIVWGDTYNAAVSAPLANMGFVDFAGSTVVHGTGAWFGLVALLMLGPRIGRFDAAGEPQNLAGHSSVKALFGVLMLMLGWLGFNGGSLHPSDPRLAFVLFNTLSAACFGALAGMSVGVKLDNGIFHPGRITTGLLGGLVACTAGVHVMGFVDAMIIGILGGLVATYGSHFLLHRYHLDDPLDVVATHGFAGVLGTLAVAFVLPQSALVGSSRVLQFGVQLLGVCVVFLIACGGCWLIISVIKRFMEYRVSEQAELLGLNYSEHGESMGLSRLQKALESGALADGSFSDGPLVNADDEHSELAATLNKVVQQYKSVNEEVLAANHRFQQFAETATDWLWESDTNLAISFVHASASNSEFCFREALLGRNLLDVLEIDKETRQIIREAVAQQQDTPVFEATLRPLRDADIRFDVEVRGVAYADAADQFRGYRGTITDISVRKSAETRAVFLSRHDELTGLPNRRALADDLSASMLGAENTTRIIIVAGVDLDGFKAVNDTYGHSAGDDLLRQVADRMSGFLRHSDVAYRTGGDEFVILLPVQDVSCVADLSLGIMQRLIEELSGSYVIGSQSITIGASVGVSVFPQDDTTFESLLIKADQALYVAKSRGKGCAVMFDDSMGDEDSQLQLHELQSVRRDAGVYLDIPSNDDDESGEAFKMAG